MQSDREVTELLSAAKIADRIGELGQRITADYQGSGPLVVVGVLKGCFIFLADLVRAIDLPLEVEFLAVQSYGDSTQTSGVVQITADLTRPIEGRDVLIVEDIVDTGLTMEYLLENLRTRGPSSIRLCALLHKPSRMLRPTRIDYLGFTIPDEFVIGYGLDYAQRYRNLPYIGRLE